MWICHYDLTFEKVFDSVDSHGGYIRGRGRGRGRGSRRAKPKIDDKPPPFPICIRLIRDVAKRHRLHFRGAMVAHDGKKNAYTSIDPGWGRNVFGGQVDDKKFNVHFTLVAKISKADIKTLIDQSTEGKSELVKNPSSQSWIQCLDTVARTELIRNMTYTGKNFTMAPDADVRPELSIGNGCEAWACFYTSFKAMDTGLYYGFDVSYTCFYTEQSVRDFAIQVLQKTSNNPNAMEIEDPWPNGMSSYEVSLLNNELRGLKIEPLYQPVGQSRKPSPIKCITNRSAREIECEGKDGRKISIADYFEQIGEPLKHPRLPCIDMQSGKNGHTFIPLEKAKISAAQRRLRQMPVDMHSRMIQMGARDPLRRSRDISKMFEKVNLQTAPTLRAFGIDVHCGSESIEGRILTPPLISFSDAKLCVEDRETEDLSWSLSSHQLWKVNGELDDWGLLISASDFTKSQAKEFVQAFRIVAEDLGMTVREPIISFGYQQTVATDLINLYQKVKKVSAEKTGAEGRCRIIMVVKDDAGVNDYDQIKNCGETYLGIPTQCVVKHHAEEPRELYLKNVILKVNAKLDGVNWTLGWESISCLAKRVGPNGKATCMIIGICVTHPPAMRGKNDRPSVAATVGSLDPLGNRWASSIRLCSATENGIDSAPRMVYDVLLAYRRENGCFPTNLLIYRSGVSDGQFQHVKVTEVVGIRAEVERCSQMDFKEAYKPRITFIVMQKRHHTRFFPVNGERMDITNNCVPGTVVDRTVGHSVNYDFYLISHNSPQGTVRPVRYILLEDDLNFDADEIQCLTYNLAFAFCRSTRPVASVPAVLYAELLSIRARSHLSARDYYKDMKSGREYDFLRSIPDKLFEGVPVVPPNLRTRLYYV